MSVPQIVQPDPTNTRDLHASIERLCHPSGPERIAVLSGEYQARVRPRFAPTQLVFELRGSVPFEQRDGFQVDGDVSCFPGLRRSFMNVCADCDEAAAHGYLSGREVDVVPSQRE